MSKKTNRKSKIVNRKSFKVWRIFHFAGRFELPEDIKICRKSGLQYTKRFVGVAGGDEAVGYQNQFAMLENGDGLEACLLEGIYGRLVNMAAQHSFAKRGYLIDADDQPLSDSQIAKLLNINYRSMGKYLRMFEKVKLLERVEMPEFDMSLNDQFDRAKNRSARKSSENSGKFRKPLKKDKTKTKAKAKSKSKTKINNKKNILGLKSSDKENQTKPKQSRKRTGRAQGQGPLKDRTSTSPTTAPASPIGPTVSDEGGLCKTVSDEGDSAKVIPFAGSPGSVSQSNEIADGVRRVKARLNPQAEAAAIEIYRLLGGAWPPGNDKRTAQDLGAFRNAFVRVFESGLPPPVAGELWDSLVKEAERLSKVYRANGGYQIAKKTWFKPVLRDKLEARLKAM